jgi:hypothetical protein
MIVSFSAPDGFKIDRCTALFQGRSPVDCTLSGGVWSVRLAVPADAEPGSTAIVWILRYSSDKPDSPGVGDGRGSITFTVLPPTRPVPGFSVVARPPDGIPGTQVTVSFTPTEPGIEISSCTARFPDGTAARCAQSGDVWTAALTVPRNAKAQTTSIAWGLSYREVVDRSATGTGSTADTVAFTVLPLTGVAPRFSVVARPREGIPGTPVTVSFTPAEPGTTISNCTARFPNGTPARCTQSSHVWTARLTVPNNAKAQTTLIAWGLSYRPGTATGVGNANGNVAFRVLSLPSPTSTGSSIGPVLLFLLVGLILFAIAFIGWRLRRPPDRDRSRNPPAERVQALLRDDRPPDVTVDDGDPRSTHAIRLESHQPAVFVSTDEVHR